MNPQLTLAHKFINETKQAIFLTGKAGTGKTTFLRNLKNNTQKNLVIAAPTGVAAINAGGVTLHSLFQLPFTPFVPEIGSNRFGNEGFHDKSTLLAKVKYNKERLGILRNMELLVIDEISMVRADVLDAIDTILQSVRRNYAEPFGGVQVLFIGDLYQLPPVAKTDEWQLLAPYYKTAFFFEAKALQQHKCVCITLTKIYRQTDDAFIEILNAIRNNQVNNNILDKLNQRYLSNVNNNIITLTTHNAQAQNINESKLAALSTKSLVFTASVNGDFSEYAYPIEKDLELKLGAQVMFIKNDVSGKKQYYNGKIGVVTKLSAETIEVTCPNDAESIEVQKETWENIKYQLDPTNNTLHEEAIGSFTQWPLRLAWAITIHKSQGLTFENVAIDGAKSFVAGQLYVALSRCTTLNGIILLSKIEPSALHVNEAIKNYMHEASNTDNDLLFSMAQQHYASEVLMELYSFSKLQNIILQLQQLIIANKGAYSSNSCLAIYNDEVQISKLQVFATRFQQELQNIIRVNTAEALNSQILQERTSKANAYFAPYIMQIIKSVKTYGISLDSKILASETDIILNDLYVELVTKLHFYKASSGAFSIENYFKRKAALHIETYKPNTYAVSNKKVQAPPECHYPQLYVQLRELRDSICQDNGLDVFKVANNKTLVEMCNYLPCNNLDITFISGFGAIKAKQFGSEFTDIINDYCEANNLESNITQHPKFSGAKAKQAKQKENALKNSIKLEHGVTATVLQSVEMLKDGNSLEQIAQQRNLSITTIEGHLADAVSAGKLNAAEVLDEATLQLIQEKLQNNLNLSLTEQKNLVGQTISFGQLKIAIAHFKRMAEA